MAFLSHPHEAFSAGFYKNTEFDLTVRGLLGHAPSGATEPGEVLATIAGISHGDVDAWFDAWHGLGTRLLATANQLQDAGHLESASGAYLRASRYLTVAVNAASAGNEAALQPTFREYRTAWNGFVDTTVYSAERVDIPYSGITLPGYLFRPSDDGEARPTVILNNGSDGSHSSLWGDGAFGALKRGYNVLFFDGPGQQSMLFEQLLPFRFDWEKVITPVVDFLVTRPEVDATKLALYGISQGGYWVPRALAFEHRIAAAIADPGVVDVSTSWTDSLSASLTTLLAEGKKDTFDRDMALGLRFNPEATRTWAFRARPFQKDSYYDTLVEVRKYALGSVTSTITTPLFITSPEDEQFWPGQSQQLADELTGERVIQAFTAAEGANLHCQPLARTLTDQRMFDWLDEKLGLLE